MSMEWMPAESQVTSLLEKVAFVVFLRTKDDRRAASLASRVLWVRIGGSWVMMLFEADVRRYGQRQDFHRLNRLNVVHEIILFEYFDMF